MDVPYPGAYVECGPVYVLCRYAFIGSFVVVVAIGQIYFRSFESLIVHAELQAYRKFAAELPQFVGKLRAQIERFVQAGAFLVDDHTQADTLFPQTQGHVGCGYESAGGVVYAYPLHPCAAAYAQQVGLSYGSRVVECWNFVVL